MSDAALWSETDEISDEELTALALAADPREPIPDDSVPLALYSAGMPAFLPTWYMPPVMRRGPKRWHRWAIAAVIVAFVTIDLFGLCSTYGPLSAA
jgi:hypothetical protein